MVPLALLFAAAALAALPPWKTSRVVGSPEPPSAYMVEPAFPNLRLDAPTVITSAPGTDRLFVGLRDGRVVSFANDARVSSAQLFLDTNVNLPAAARDARTGRPANRIVYGLTFHPRYATNGYVYLFTTEPWPTPRIAATRRGR